MENTLIVEAVENRSLIEASNLIEKSLYFKAGTFLTEKKKQYVANTWRKTLTESDAKEIFHASLRKAFKDKMKKFGVKKAEK